MEVFFNDEDRQAYLRLIREMGHEYGVKFWGYCLMPNHVHLIAVPQEATSLAQAIGWAHYHYTRRINFREGWRGYLWQGRFHSCPLDEAHAVAALRYVELNPVRAGLVKEAERWPWSSARAHVRGMADPVLSPVCLIGRGKEWGKFLSEGMREEEFRELRGCTRTGRPWGPPAFVKRLEATLRRDLQRGKPGPKGEEGERGKEN